MVNRLILVLCALSLMGCTPLVGGAGAAVVADEASERKNGGDGLF